MLPIRERRRFSADEYLMVEEQALTKSEFCAGEIFAMSGASLEHNRLVRNLIIELGNGLKGKSCEVFPSDLRLHVERYALYTYPDVLVVCGPPRLLPGRKDTLVDATLIIEVLSPSTRDYDRNDKFRFYRELPSFSEYLLVAQDELKIEHHRRVAPGQWLLTDFGGEDSEIVLSSIDVSLRLDEIYRGVFGSAESA